MLNIFLSPCRSYGCVFKANYKETGEIVAIKQVPVESDLQEIIKEISIMQQCNRYLYAQFIWSYVSKSDKGNNSATGVT